MYYMNTHFLSAMPVATRPKKPTLGAKYLAAALPKGPPTAPLTAPTVILVPRLDQVKFPQRLKNSLSIPALQILHQILHQQDQNHQKLQ